MTYGRNGDDEYTIVIELPLRGDDHSNVSSSRAAAFSYLICIGQFLHVIPLHLHGGMGVQTQGGADV